MHLKQDLSARRRDRERIMFGTQGAASSVRIVDLVSVDTAALIVHSLSEQTRPTGDFPGGEYLSELG